MPLYHKVIGFPRKMKLRAVEGLTPSNHAIFAAKSDPYNVITIPTKFIPEEWDVIEIETNNGALQKVVARQSFNEKFDLIMVFIPHQKIIKTVWLNNRNDTHDTLDFSRYDRP